MKNLPAVNSTGNAVIDAHRPAPAVYPEVRLDQYGPEWVAMVSAGANVRHGNIVDLGSLPALEVPPVVES